MQVLISDKWRINGSWFLQGHSSSNICMVTVVVKNNMIKLGKRSLQFSDVLARLGLEAGSGLEPRPWPSWSSDHGFTVPQITSELLKLISTVVKSLGKLVYNYSQPNSVPNFICERFSSIFHTLGTTVTWNRHFYKHGKILTFLAKSPITLTAFKLVKARAGARKGWLWPLASKPEPSRHITRV